MSLVRVPNPLPQEMTSSSQTGNLSCVSPVCTSSGSSVLQVPGAHHPKQALEWAGEPASHNSFSDLPLPFELPASSQVHADLHLEVALSLAATKTTSLPRPGHTNHLPICGVLNFFLEVNRPSNSIELVLLSFFWQFQNSLVVFIDRRRKTVSIGSRMREILLLLSIWDGGQPLCLSFFELFLIWNFFIWTPLFPFFWAEISFFIYNASQPICLLLSWSQFFIWYIWDGIPALFWHPKSLCQPLML